jgi:uncharacterized protein (TIGR01777 family)
MKILVTGGTGFIGKRLVERFSEEGHQTTVLTRRRNPEKDLPRGVVVLAGDPMQEGEWQNEIANQDVIINLAGASIFSRWTEESKKKIRDSRILTTRHLVAAMQKGRPYTFVSASGVGYYGGSCGDAIRTEESPPGRGFLAQLSRDWEEEAGRAGEKGARIVFTRFGVVLGENGGALGQMIPLFKKFLGGPLGGGNQWFSWIHREDLVSAFLFLLAHPEISGPVNFTSPNPVRNKDLAEALGEVLGRPSFLAVPGFLLKWILGEFGSMLLEGQRVIPQKLLKEAFPFQYPDIRSALAQIVGSSAGSDRKERKLQ